MLYDLEKKKSGALKGKFLKKNGKHVVKKKTNIKSK
jgi:hypothetical protein